MKISAGILVVMAATALVGATSWKTLRGEAACETTSVRPPKAAPTPPASLEGFDLSDLPRALEMPLVKTPLQPGDIAPDFNLPDQNGQMHRLSDLRGQTVVLAFYPVDFTYACSMEAISFNHDLPAFTMRGTNVFSVSVQNFASKALFAGRYNISYPLLADSDKSTAHDYRVLSENGVAGRVTFVIGTDGRIQWTDQNVRVQTHSRDVIRFLDGRAPIYDAVGMPSASPSFIGFRGEQVSFAPPSTAPRFVGDTLGLDF